MMMTSVGKFQALRARETIEKIEKQERKAMREEIIVVYGLSGKNVSVSGLCLASYKVVVTMWYKLCSVTSAQCLHIVWRLLPHTLVASLFTASGCQKQTNTSIGWEFSTLDSEEVGKGRNFPTPKASQRRCSSVQFSFVCRDISSRTKEDSWSNFL